MAWGKKSGGGGGCVSWLALLVAMAALFLAWRAYERTGGDLQEVLRTPLGESAQESAGSAGTGSADDAGRQTDLARTRLLARRTEVEARRNLRQVQEEVAEIRDNLQEAYRGAGAQARESWRELDADLQRLQGQLREGSDRAVETLDSTLDKMRRLGREDG
jgi:hypothetical protein